MAQTQLVLIEDGALHRVADVFHECFGDGTPMVLADDNTWSAAGREVAALLGDCHRLILPGQPQLPAEMTQVHRVQAALAERPWVPVAVGSGTINDLVKLAAARLRRDYLCVGTAASMDGYTAFGASITENGSKQTFDCPAPRAFLADLDVVASAPRTMAATGYADLLAKVTAGADWILADALGIEPIHREAWEILQKPLRGWLADPAGVARHDKPALKNLMDGLIAGGLAMQAMQSSRPASGAEHQFSHLWDMQGHTHNRCHVPHGAKVGIATLYVRQLYDVLLDRLVGDRRIDIDAAVSRWPSLEAMQQHAGQLHELAAIREKAILETTAKYITAGQLRDRLARLDQVRDELIDRLNAQLLPHATLQKMLTTAGAPTEPERIGISRERLVASQSPARTIRRRYTVLDLLFEMRGDNHQ